MVSRRTSLLPVFVLLVFLPACRGASETYGRLGAHAAPLRAQFNEDAGTTRIVILPAPN